MNCKEEFLRWKNSGRMDAAMEAELAAVEADSEALALHFGSKLGFGTAGLRGIMALGPGCMNVFTVAQATQGMANLIKKTGDGSRGVSIAYDTRNNSALFAEVAACVLAANDIKVYLFDAPRPTPELSFSIRALSCIAGINITASHNPKEYNGYKAYWEDGAQLPPDHADTVSAEIDKIDIFTGVTTMDYQAALAAGKITLLGEEMDNRYMAAVHATTIRPESIREVADELRIVYTPLHGTGRILVPRALREMGLTQLYTVEEQMVPDGNFPTVKKPNPEIPDAFALGIALAEQVGSDLVIATDPDADRVGVMSRKADGSFACITGNQMGALLLDYVIAARRESGKMPALPYAVKSIVSTEMTQRICDVQGVKLYNVLTGFKFIGEVIKNHEEGGEPGEFIMGFEESYGYLFGGYARDKDAVSATMLIAEMTAYYRKKGLTLSEALDGLFVRYGYYLDKTHDIYMEGLDGIERRRRTMEKLHRTPPTTLGGHRVVRVGDYLAGVITDLDKGTTEPTGLPKSDVLSYETDCGDKIIIRPSGTEPKIKIYFLTHAEQEAELAPKMAAYLADGSAFAD
ncbi:MAG: phospho-sugar mutase [Clostridia bacterium]|nr:phospho-sugar mutase [Clostridia bacterium]